MANRSPLSLNDLPSIEELNDKIEQKVRNLKRLQYEDAKDIVKLRNSSALSFLYDNFEMMEYRDKDMIHKTLKKTINFGLATLALPAVLNISLARLTRHHIYELHPALRYSIRFSIFLMPLFFWTDYALHGYARINMYLADKYVDRVELYEKLKDPTILNPYLHQDIEYINQNIKK